MLEWDSRDCITSYEARFARIFITDVAQHIHWAELDTVGGQVRTNTFWYFEHFDVAEQSANVVDVWGLDVIFCWLEEILRQLFEERCRISTGIHPHRTRRFNTLNNTAIYRLEFASNDGCPHIKGLVSW
ncbi:Uncharacterised protein [Klebsiella oxytoca]|nr:Uncharacterised protein [Klebsiella oxytoca]